LESGRKLQYESRPGRYNGERSVTGEVKGKNHGQPEGTIKKGTVNMNNEEIKGQ